MASRPLKLPGHRPLTRPEDRERPFSGAAQRRDPRLGPLARCLSRGRRPGAGAPQVRALVDAVAAREASIRRLKRLEEAHAEARIDVSEARRELVDALLHCRALSLEVVEAFESWRAGGSRGGPMTDPGYLVRMKDDTRWLAESTLAEFLNFSTKSDPFFVAPSSREAPTTAPTNQMTPTLQAKRRSNPDRRQAVLPLQSSLLRRIRKAELMIMKESMQVRLQQQDAAVLSPPSRSQEPSPSKSGAAAESPKGWAASQQAAASPPAPPVAREPQKAPAAASPSQVATIKLAPEVTAGAVPSRPKPTRPPEPPAGAFKLLPLGVKTSAVKALFEEYVSRVPGQLVSGQKWKDVEVALEDQGPLGLEWFWLQRQEASSTPGPSSAEGLAVFRMKKQGSNCFGQLVHFTVVDPEAFEEAIAAVRCLMFAYLPIKAIRFTLWHHAAEDGTMQLNKDVEAAMKKNYWRWFQLTNSGGIRGQVMQRPRGEPPDDPVKPVEVPSIELCLGQVWLRGARSASRVGSCACAGNLAIAAACLKALRGKDTAEMPAPESLLDTASAAAWAAAKEGLVKAMLTGELDKALAALKPVRLKTDNDNEQGIRNAAGARSAAGLAQSLAQALEATKSGSLPEVLVQAVAEAAELVRRGCSQEALKQASDGLGVEDLPDAIKAMDVKDGCFGRLTLCLEWQAVNLLDEHTFEVPVFGAGSCPRHAHPVLYLSTTEDDIFVVIIPWHGLPGAPSTDEDAFAACTEIIRATTPTETSPYGTVKLFNLDVRRAAQTREIKDATALGMPSESLHVVEFSSLSVSGGRVMPGQLRSSGAAGQQFVAQKPFALCLWHGEMDEINAPLSAMMVS